MVQQGKMNEWLAEIQKALKPNGVLGIEQHRAKADANPEESAKKGYLPEKWVIEKVEAAGFKLAGKSEVNANAKDTKDYEGGVWNLPPSYRLGDKDREKYAAIGESDRMTLKFTKVAKAAPKGDKPATTTAAPAKPATTTAAPAKPATPATPPAKKP
jgi:predicted methyltransferase